MPETMEADGITQNEPGASAAEDPVLAAYQRNKKEIESMYLELNRQETKKREMLNAVLENQLEYERQKQYHCCLFASKVAMVQEAQYQQRCYQAMEKDVALRDVRQACLDSATNLVFTRLQREVENWRDRLDQIQSDLQVFQYEPDSQEAKKLRLRLKHLLEENMLLGGRSGSVQVQSLENDIAMHKSLNEDLKNQLKENEVFYQNLSDDLDKLQGCAMVLQQQLLESEALITKLSTKLDELYQE